MSPMIQLGPEDAAHLLSGGMLSVNVAQMRKAGPNRPRIHELIKSRRLRYKSFDPEEEWVTYSQAVERIQAAGFVEVDCEDIATLVAAELVADGLDPEARPVVYQSGAKLFHVVTHTARWGYLDACISAGMYGEAS